MNYLYVPIVVTLLSALSIYRHQRGYTNAFFDCTYSVLLASITTSYLIYVSQ